MTMEDAIRAREAAARALDDRRAAARRVKDEAWQAARAAEAAKPPTTLADAVERAIAADLNPPAAPGAGDEGGQA